jgi:hypothetical protein
MISRAPEGEGCKISAPDTKGEKKKKEEGRGKASVGGLARRARWCEKRGGMHCNPSKKRPCGGKRDGTEMALKKTVEKRILGFWSLFVSLIN